MEPTWASNFYQYGFGISAGLAAMAAGAWLSWPSSVIPMFQSGNSSIYMDSAQVSTMVALMDLGNILSPVPSSYLMDSIGRKLTLIISGFCCLLASCAVLFFHQVWLIYSARILAGISKGITFAVVPIYLAEVANTKIRGGLSTMFIGFLNLGMLFDFLVGPYASYFYLNIANLIIPLLFLVTIIMFPESPYYMVMKRRERAARKSLSRFSRVSATSLRSNELEAELNLITNKVDADMKNKARFIDIFQTASNRRALLIISMLAFFQRSSGISPTIAYSSTIMPAEGGGLDRHAYMIMFSVSLVLSNYLALPLVDRLGRKPLLLISSISTAFVTGSVGIFYYLQKNSSIDVSAYNWITYAGLIAFSFTYSIGIGFLPSTLVGELFPTNVKSYAGSVSAMILAAVSFTVNKVFKAVGEAWGIHVMYAYFTLSCIACTVFVFIYVFETKGKTLKEIQDYLIRFDNKVKAEIV